MNIIEVQGLSKYYKKFKAVDDISLSVKKGEVFGMLGPNGAGKTTTLECMLGLKPFLQGEITVAGLNPKKDQKKMCQLVGAQLQETSYQDKIKVKEICSLFEALYENHYPYVKLIERFGLKDKTNAYVSDLSGGQRQKLSIILALIGNPQVVFLDELTTGLDPEARRQMWEYIQELKAEGRTVMMTTHYMEEAEYLCDRICIINRGQLVAYDTIDHIIDNSGIDHEVSFICEDVKVEGLLRPMAHIKSIEKMRAGYVVKTTDDQTVGKIIYTLENERITYKRLNIKRPSLDDVFIQLTGLKKGDY